MVSRSPIIPAILTVSEAEFVKRLDFARVAADAVHIDVIDGEFCQGSSLSIDKWPDLNINYAEVHLMVNNPQQYLERLASKKITRAIVHVEAIKNITELASRARELDILLGVAINPDTDLDELRPFLSATSYVQLMGVHPGAAGQTMQDTTPLAVSYLSKHPTYRLTISVDGGVLPSNLKDLKQAGAQYFVSTQAIFHDLHWQDNLNNLYEALK